MAEVKVPGIGPVKKPVAVIGGGLVLVLAIYWYRQHKASQAAAASTSTTASPVSPQVGYGAGADPYPPDGTTGNPSDPNSTDPATGQTYGDEQAGYGGGAYGYGGGYGYGGYPGGYGGGGGGPGPGSYTTNAQWAQAAEQYMGSTGADAIAAALGKYITGQDVTPDQQTIIQEAIAAEGYPPVNGPAGYPPSMKLTSGPPPGGGGGSPVNPVPGFTVSGKGATSATFSWSRDPGTKTFEFTLKDGATVKDSRPALSATTTTVTAGGLRKGQRYTATLRALPQAPGSREASLTFTL